MLLLLFFDGLILLLHLTLGSVSTFFHLDFEHNVPTVYQAVKLLSAGYLLLFGILELKEKFLDAAERWLLYPLAALFIFLGLDEIGVLHENVDHYVREVFPAVADSMLVQAEQVGYFSSTWILYCLSLIILMGLYGLYALRFVIRFRPKLLVLLIAFGGLLASTLVFEFLANQNHVDAGRYQLLAIFEESSELFGISLGFVFVVKLFQWLAITNSSSKAK